MCYIICKNCGRKSLFDYFDFCSVFCCADYSSKHDLSFENSQYDYKSQKIEDLECDKEELESEISHLETSLWRAGERIEELKRTAREELDIEVKNKLEELNVTKKDLINLKKSYKDFLSEFGELEEKFEELEEKNKELEESNKVLRNKYTKFDIMDI